MKTKNGEWIVGVLTFGLLFLMFNGLFAGEAPLVEWQKTFGGTKADQANSVQRTTDGGYIVAGYTTSFSADRTDRYDVYDVYLIKTNSNGNLLWQKNFDIGLNDVANSVQQTTDGGYIVAGTTYNYPHTFWIRNAYLIKINSNGGLLWRKTFGGTGLDCWANSVQQTTDGGYIVAGEIESSGTEYNDAYLIKTDSNGNLQWQKTFGGTNDDYANSVQQTSDGGYIVAGTTKSFGAGYTNAYLIKTDSNGNFLWQKIFNEIYDDEAYSVQQTPDHGYIVAGETWSFGAGGYDFYLIKTDSNGELLWQKTFGGIGWDRARSVQQTTDGGYIVAGMTTSFGAGYTDAHLIKTDSNGNLRWQKTFGGIGWDWANSVQQTTDGGYIVAGWTDGAGSEDVYLVKIAPERTAVSSRLWTLYQ